MISATYLLTKLEMRLNKVSSNTHQSIDYAYMLLVLSEAQIKLMKRKVDSNNIYQLGLDAFKKRYQDLQNLIVPMEEFTPSPTASIYPSYQYSLTSLTHPYFLPLDIAVLANRDRCTDRVIAVNTLVKHGDLATVFSNEHTSPSFSYQETVGQVTDNNLIIYTNDPKGAFTISKGYISYLRYPKPIGIAGYFNPDGSPTVNQDCELASHLEDELLDIATLELAMNTENTPQVQFSDIRNKTNE